ncbi:MAG: hypothetical protein QF752_04160 [Planctomycetota bacterium]|jgi:hypothetical protein|nr:hypothetical protein [Planctomycetota bacterium]
MTRRFSTVFIAFTILAGSAVAAGGVWNNPDGREKFIGKGTVKSERFSGWKKYRDGRYLKDAYLGLYTGADWHFQNANILASARLNSTAGLYIFNTYNELAALDTHVGVGTNNLQIRLFGSTVFRMGYGGKMDEDWWKSNRKKKLGTFTIGPVPVSIYAASGFKYYVEADINSGVRELKMSGTAGCAPWVSVQAVCDYKLISAGLELMATIASPELHLDVTIDTTSQKASDSSAVCYLSFTPLKISLNFIANKLSFKCKKRKKGIYCGWRKRWKKSDKTFYRKTLASVNIGAVRALYFFKKGAANKNYPSGKWWVRQ